MSDALRSINIRSTPQTEQSDPREVKNSAGGYVFAIDDEARLLRFLILGVSGGTYYTSQKDLAKDNAEVVIAMANKDPKRLVDLITQISLSGRAPKANPAIFALAVAASMSGTDEDRVYALASLPLVCRTGTHLFLFATYVEQFRGWGRALRRAIGSWYLDKQIDDLAYQMVKYRQREGWTHRDLLRLAHPKPEDADRSTLLGWAAAKTPWDPAGPLPGLPAIVEQYERAKTASAVEVAEMVRMTRLPWEAIPDQTRNTPEVWGALLDAGMPMTALIRNLPTLTRQGILVGPRREAVIAQITDPERLAKARIHPINLLVAQKTYAEGASARGSNTWSPIRQVVDALDEAFYASFATVEPTSKRVLFALDVSGSMGAPAGGLPITCREVGAALAMAMVRVEKDAEVVGYTAASGGWVDPLASRRWYGTSGQGITPLAISPRQRLDDILRVTDNLPFGATDCALPLRWAQAQGKVFDAVVTLTDNETWAGPVHVNQALKSYREYTGLPVRHIAIALTPTGWSVNDPDDMLGLDVAGFDAAVPTLVSDFIRGDL